MTEWTKYYGLENADEKQKRFGIFRTDDQGVRTVSTEKYPLVTLEWQDGPQEKILTLVFMDKIIEELDAISFARTYVLEGRFKFRVRLISVTEWQKEQTAPSLLGLTSDEIYPITYDVIPAETIAAWHELISRLDHQLSLHLPKPNTGYYVEDLFAYAAIEIKDGRSDLQWLQLLRTSPPNVEAKIWQLF